MLYRKLDAGLWDDPKFVQLSDRAKLLWIHILTGPHHDGVPGIFQIGRGGLAEQLRWEIHEVDEFLEEILAADISLVADWRLRVLVIPKTLRYDPPANGDVVKAWRKKLERVPKCAAVDTWLDELQEHLEGRDAAHWADPMEDLRHGAGHGVGHGVPHGVGHGVEHRAGHRAPHPKPKPKSKPKPKPKDSGYSLDVGNRPSSQATPASERAVRDEPGDPVDDPPEAKVTPIDRDAQHRAEYEAWQASLLAAATDNDVPAALVHEYLHELDQSLADYYDARGGRLTWRRKAHVARTLARGSPETALFAVEVFVDKHFGTKDERYVAGIGRRLQRLSNAEQQREMDTHRRHQAGRGLYASVTQATEARS